MKSYSIGREPGCDIVINDSTDVVSRRHAVLTVSSTGKMTITDQSHNGTYVNGIRISSNVPFPVTRKDNISFAHVARLEWNRVPQGGLWIKILAAIVVVLVLALIGWFGFGNKPTPPTPVQPTDTTTTQKPEPEKVDSCVICKKPVKDCEFGGVRGDHPCPTCHKKLSACEYNGKHPKQPANRDTTKTKNNPPAAKVDSCSVCHKPIKDCAFKGKHPNRRRG